MTMNKNMWFLIGYALALISLLYFGINGLISSTLSDSFPNRSFLIVLGVMFIVAWSLGLGTRHYLKNVSKNNRNTLKNSLLNITLLSWILLLLLFTFT